MVQVNLLPDVKQEYLRSQQVKYLVVVAAILFSFVSLIILGLLFAYVQVVQPHHRTNVQQDIDGGIQELKNKENAVKIVTVQGVLEQIPALQDKKMLTSSLFTYLTNFTPKGVNYSEVKLDLTNNTISVSGQANTLEQTNELANNLKGATFTYTQNDNQQDTKPFSRVVFASLGKSEQSTSGKEVAFQLTFTFDPVMFSQGITNPALSVNASSEKLLLPTEQVFGNTQPKPAGGQQ